MARIPLTQIPNAPELPEPVLSHAPRVAVDLSAMARRTQQDTLDPRAFDAPARGLQAAGEAIGEAGGVFQQLGRRMVDSRNQADLSRAEDIMSQARAAHEQDMLTLPEDQWAANWDQHSAAAVKQIQALNVSPLVRSQVVPQYAHFDQQMRTATSYEALKQSLNRDRQDTLKVFDSSIQQGNTPGALRAIACLEAGHHITPVEAGLMKDQVKDVTEQRTLATALNQDAANVLKDTTEGLTTNKSKLFPFLDGQPEKIARLHYNAKALVQQQETEAFQSAQDDLYAGSTFDQVRQRYGAALPDRKLHILEKAARSFREWDPAVDGPTAEHLRADIANYQRDADPDLNQLDTLQARIADLPRNKQGYLNSLLSQQYEKSTTPDKDPAAHDQQLAYWLGEANRLGQAGYLGATGRHRKNFNVITDPAQSAAYGEKLQSIRLQLQDWSKQNPKATPQQWRDQFYQTVQPYTDNQAANIWSSGPTSAPGAVAQPSPVPVTNYSLGRDVGGADPVQDANTNRGYSALGPNLTPGAAAVNTSRYPIGTIFQDHDTGEIFLATDRHGNDDANVVDLYQSSDRYQDTKGTRNLSVIGRAAHIPRDAKGLRKLLASLGKVPEGESAAETLARLRGANLAEK